MLTDLIIRNFAIIDRLQVVFGAGFNVLTGETGAASRSSSTPSVSSWASAPVPT